MAKSVLSPVELQILALITTERTGRQVAELYRHEAGRRIAHGSLYTSLRRLRARGLVTAREDRAEDCRIRYFLATREGMEALQRSRAYYGRLGYFGLAAETIGSVRESGPAGAGTR